MRIDIIGAGPAGLCAALAIRATAGTYRVALLERRPAHEEAGGLGIVLSETALRALALVDSEAAAEVCDTNPRWDHVEIRGESWSERFGGHAYVGIERDKLLDILRRRCTAQGVSFLAAAESMYSDAPRSADVVVAADGVRSRVRETRAAQFGPSWREGSNYFTWLGCSRAFPCHAFLFSEHRGYRWCAHVYPFTADTSTFIVECSPVAAGELCLVGTRPEDTVSLCEEIFSAHLDGARLLATPVTRWQRYRVLHTRRWMAGNVVLLGDAAHSVHFSVGVGTRMAMEDGLALAHALSSHGSRGSIKRALAAYELERRSAIERLLQAAGQSEAFFERALSELELEPHEIFVLALMTRSGRVNADRILAAGYPSFARRLRGHLQFASIRD